MQKYNNAIHEKTILQFELEEANKHIESLKGKIMDYEKSFEELEQEN